MLQLFLNDVFEAKFFFLAQPVIFYAQLASVHQAHHMDFFLFDGHLTAIFDATKLPQFFVLPIYVKYYAR